MLDTHVRIEVSKHEKMKKIASEKGVEIKELYDKVIGEYIKEYIQETVIKDSGLEFFLNEKISKVDKHIASMLGRTGMDTSMILMANVILLSKLLKIDEVEIQKELRHRGARYFANVIKSDKEKNRKGE